MIDELLQDAHASGDAVLGAGIGMQGLVSEDGQRMLYGKIPDCTGLTIRPLSERVSISFCNICKALCM